MATVRSVIISTVVFVAFGMVFGMWLLRRPHADSTVLTFFLVGAVLVGIDLIRQLYLARENRVLVQRTIEDAERTAKLNRDLQAAQRELKEANRELAAANEQLTTLAGTDPTTALPNQRQMSHLIDTEIERSRRTGRPFALLFLDIDHFKGLNDRHGHLVGDEALREFARVAQTTLRGIDTLGRWGGEEFLVLLPEADTPSAVQAAERVRAVVAEHVYRINGEGLYLTCSVGVAVYPEDGRDQLALVNMADHAMYVAKKLGRNQVRSTHDPMVALDSGAAIPGDDGGKGRRGPHLALAVSQAVAHLLDEEQRAAPYMHALTVLSMKLALAMGLSEEEARKIGIAAQLQNIGYVSIPDAIMQQISRYTDEERAVMQRHASLGAEIVAGVPALADLAPMIAAHHEWWNGQGYPSGLREDDIPLGARILTVVDVYKALTSDRPYRPARNSRAALDELRFRSGTQFDPKVVEALQRALAPNPVISERVLVEEYSRAYRESQAKLVKVEPPRRSFLVE